MIWNKIKDSYGYSDYEIKLMQYTITAIVSEISKFLILLVFFSSISKTHEFLTAIIVLLLLRCNTGGLHFKHYSSCLLVTFLLILLSTCILPLVLQPNMLATLVLLLVCIIINYQIGPIQSVSRPAPDHNLYIRSKINSFTFVFLYLILAYIIQNHPLIMIGFWTIILQTMQLVFAYILKPEGGATNDKKSF